MATSGEEEEKMIDREAEDSTEEEAADSGLDHGSADEYTWG